MLSKNNENYNVPQMLIEVNRMKEDKMYKKMYLEERVNRLRAEMSLMQERFSVLQVNLQNAEKELHETVEKEENLKAVEETPKTPQPEKEGKPKK